MKNILLFLSAVIIPFFAWSQPDQVTVKGSVIDSETKQPLMGVSIIESGTYNGVSSDFDGDFQIKVEQGATLEISSLGYEQKSIKVEKDTKLIIELAISENDLDEVIVTGYTNQSKRKLTSAVSNIDRKDLQDAATPDVSGMLQGKAAGVDVMSASGQPGEKPNISIRGISSLNGNTSPLWVVDGAIVHEAPDLNPNEVESISILKDASATALYGSRGSNGVVVVTTRSGRSGETTISVSSKIGMSKFNMGKFEVMNSQELYDYYQQFGNQDRVPRNITEDVLNTDFNWLENGTQDGMIQDHNISLVGGEEKMRTFFSLGYYRAEGSLKGFNYDKLSTRLNLDYDINDRLTIKPKLAVNYTTTENRQHDIYTMNTNMPWDSPYDENGDLVNPLVDNREWFGRDQNNYMYDLQWNYGKGDRLNLSTDLGLEYDITPNIKFISTNSFTLFYSQGKSYTDPLSNSGTANKGALDKSHAQRITKFTNQMLKYSNYFGAHEVNALFAYEYNDYNYESTGARGKGLVAGSEILDITAIPDRVNGTRNQYALQSLLTNLDYSYDGKYMAQVSVRYDGASNFGENNKYGTFFSLSGGWNIHSEDFFDSEMFDQLKLRVSYGSVGNRPSSLYPQYSRYALDNSYNGNPSATPSQLGNDDLTWERSYQTNLAIDTRVFDRVNLSLEYYIKNTSDLLYFVALPAVTGYTGSWQNIGGVKNKGVEATLTADLMKKDSEFQWNLNFNIGANSNKVDELADGQEIDRGHKISREGEDYNSWYMRKWIGVDSENGKPLWETIDSETGEATTTSDYNEATKQIVGSSSPDFYGGLISNMTYKNFNLGMNFTFVQGGEVFNLSRELYDADGAYPTYNQQKLNSDWSRWEEPGDEATHPELLYGGNNNSNKPSSRYLEDGSYLRLRNIQLGYTFNEKFLSSMQLQTAQVYVSVDNVFTLTKFSGTDPEVGSDGIYNNSYPIPRRFMLGINLSF